MPLYTRAPDVPREAPDELISRRELRRQITAIERRLEPTALDMGSRGPRLLSLGELEAVRDVLVAAERDLSRARAQAEAKFAYHRSLLEDMRARPEHHRYRRLPLAALGEPGCGVYRVRPRLGLVGMLAGWWELTLSSGCP